MTRIARIVINTLLLVALAEGVARIVEWVHPPAEDLSFDYAPYRMLKMNRAPWPLNREGFRARELDTYRNTFLIEFLGGSVCMGIGTNPGRTVPERLEDALHQAGLGRAAVLNLCQAGATSAQELAIFLQYGLPRSPQVVLSFDGANDLMHPRPIGDDDAANLPYRNREMQALFDDHHSWVAHLALARVAGRIAARRVTTAVSPAVATDSILHSYLYSLDVVRTLTRAKGGWYAVVFQPTLHYQKPWSAEERSMWKQRRPVDGEPVSKYTADLYEKTRVALADWSKETGANVFDLSESFAATPDTVYSDSVHFTGETGYAKLSAELARQGWMDQIKARYREWETHSQVETGGRSTWAR